MAEDEKTGKIRFFYETAAKIFDTELERSKNIDDKAFKVATVSGILMALIPLVVHYAPDKNSHQFVLSSIILVAFLSSQLCCWFFLLLAAYPIQFPKIDILKLNLQEYLALSLEQVYETFYGSYQEDVREVKERIDTKVNFLKASMICLTISLIIYFLALSVIIRSI